MKSRILFLVCIPALLEAQAWSYPAFQPAQVTSREFNFAVADAGGYGTSLVFQWRELTNDRSQLSLDGGVGAPDGRRADNVLFVFGQYARELHRSSAEVPFDFLFTAGAGLSLGSGTLLRVPAGVSIGHRFELDRNLALSPWVHPRLSLDFCSCDESQTELGVEFDVGANLEVTPRMAIRLAVLFAGNERFYDDAIGISLAWTPPGLRRQRAGRGLVRR
ncbi:MAG: hypothetical protein ACT4OZ_17825 [Gemmatimonadota bacterium]